MSQEEINEKDKLDRIESINFLQNQIAKYYGNDGELSLNENEELTHLYQELGVSKERFDRLVRLAKEEIENFKKFDVMSYLLGREDKAKLYSDAEKLSIRISRVESWIADLRERATPGENNKKAPTERRRSENLVRNWFELPLCPENPSTDKEKWRSVEDLLKPENRLLSMWSSPRKDDIRKIRYQYRLAELPQNQESDFFTKQEYSGRSPDEVERIMESKRKIENQIKEYFNRSIVKDDKSGGCQDELVKLFTKSELKIILSTLYLEKDIDRLLDKSGYVEERECMDVTVHKFALIVYIFVVIFFGLVIYSFLFSGFSLVHLDVEGQGSEADLRDREIYKTVKIGNIEWLTRNLNYDTGNSLTSDLPTTDGGRLYSWNDAVTACLDGWRMPTVEEWRVIINEVGGDSIAARYLKSQSEEWDNLQGNDSLGFSALPAGFIPTFSNKKVRSTNKLGSWWAFSMLNEKEAYQVRMTDVDDRVEIIPTKIEAGLSVRCIREDEKYVPTMKNPNTTDTSAIVKKYKATVVGYREQSNLPVLRLSSGKKDSIYSMNLMSDIQWYNSTGENANIEKRPLFLLNSTVNMRRYYDKSFSRKKDGWIRDSVWQRDSITVTGNYPIVDFTDLPDGQCNAAFKAGLGLDSLVFVKLGVPCTSINLDTEYQLVVDFTIAKPKICSGECKNLNYQIISSEVHPLR